MNPDITELKALYLLLADDELLRRCSSGTLTGQAQLVAETEVLARGLALPTGRSFSSPDLEDHKYRGDLEINETAIDARPVLPVSQDSLWDHAAKKRDNIASIIDSEFKQQNITAWIRKSQPGEYPLYVLVDIWIPKGETSQSVTLDRNFLKVIISVAPCRVHSLI